MGQIKEKFKYMGTITFNLNEIQDKGFVPGLINFYTWPIYFMKSVPQKCVVSAYTYTKLIYNNNTTQNVVFTFTDFTFLLFFMGTKAMKGNMFQEWNLV